MKVTERVGKRLRSDVVPRVEKLLHRPVPERVLHSRVAQRLGAQALKALEQLTLLATRAEAVRSVRESGPQISDRFAELRRELEKVLRPPDGASGAQTAAGAAAPAPEKKKATRKMPELIHAGGGKRIPAAVARRAVKNPNVEEFKPKKGKRH